LPEFRVIVSVSFRWIGFLTRLSFIVVLLIWDPVLLRGWFNASALQGPVKTMVSGKLIQNILTLIIGELILVDGVAGRNLICLQAQLHLVLIIEVFLFTDETLFKLLLLVSVGQKLGQLLVILLVSD